MAVRHLIFIRFMRSEAHRGAACLVNSRHIQLNAESSGGLIHVAFIYSSLILLFISCPLGAYTGQTQHRQTTPSEAAAAVNESIN